MECGGNSEGEDIGYESVDDSLITPCSINQIIDMNKKTRLNRSRDNSILDRDIISFY